MSRRIVIRACYVSHNGRVRDHNEDGLLLNDLLVSEASMETVECRNFDGGTQIYVVADGMGGHAKGEVASRTVLEIFRNQYHTVKNSSDILRIVRDGQKALNDLIKKDPGSFGLGTTVAGIAFPGGEKAIIFHCGDSRVYRLNERVLERLTMDHSLVQEMMAAGLITEEEMRTHPRKNVITAAVIGDARSDIPSVSLKEVDLTEGKRFLLCTDGVWEAMPARDMEDCFQGEGIEGPVECLFRSTLDRGPRDNLTIIGLEVAKR